MLYSERVKDKRERSNSWGKKIQAKPFSQMVVLYYIISYLITACRLFNLLIRVLVYIIYNIILFLFFYKKYFV